MVHPLDTLVSNHQTTTGTQPTASTPASPGRQGVAVGTAARGGSTPTVPQPPIPCPYPPLGPGEELEPIPWPAPCLKCGSYELWWDGRGRQRCQRCESRVFRRAMRCVQIVRRIRGVAKVIASVKE